MGARAYRPAFRSQFDYNGVHADWGYVNETGRTVNGHPARYWEGKNCAFAAGAMALDRHTLGGQAGTPNDLRDVTNVTSPSGASLGNIATAWSKAHLIKTGWTDQHLEVHSSLAWGDFIAALNGGHGAIIVGYQRAIPAKYQCQPPRSAFRGAHAMFVGEVREDGALLCFDPICRPSDAVPGAFDKTVLDPIYWPSHPKEDQPHWIPAAYVKHYAELWFGVDTHGNPRHPGRVQCGLTKATPIGAGGDTLHPDIWAVYADGSWTETVSPAGTPDDLEQITRAWEIGEQWEGAYNLDTIELAEPEIVISGEEGRVDDWRPTDQGYGVQGPAFYLAAGSNKGVRSRTNGWFLHPWDIGADYFFTGLPAWPEGKAYLTEAVEMLNRRVGAQAFEIVNRGSMWENIELGGIYTLSQSLLGPYPDGLTMTVRVLGFSPDEDAGTMQIIAEQIGDVTSDQPHPNEDVIEQVIGYARAMFGVPYQLGAESHQHTDCSGLIYRIFADAGQLPLIGGARLSAAGYTHYFNGIHRFTTDFSKAERGDILVFKHHPISGGGRVVHCGIYTGNNHIISALTTTGVTKTLYNYPHISVDYYGVLKPNYPESNPHFTAVSTAETGLEAEEAVTTTDSLAQTEDFTAPSDPWS